MKSKSLASGKTRAPTKRKRRPSGCTAWSEPLFRRGSALLSQHFVQCEPDILVRIVEKDVVAHVLAFDDAVPCDEGHNRNKIPLIERLIEPVHHGSFIRVAHRKILREALVKQRSVILRVL